MAINRRPLGDAGLNENAINTNRSVEHLVELQGREGSLRYRQMSRGDGQVGCMLRVHKNPIRSAAWSIPVPDDANDIEKKAIEILKNVLFGSCGNKGKSFDSLLCKIISFMEYGFSLFELYWQPYEYEGNIYLIPVLEQRVQTSIQDILPADQIVRQITISKGLVDIPFENLVFFTLNEQGEDMRGESLLRNAYRSWKDKKVYQEWLGVGIQRSVSGIPSMEVPADVRVDSPDYIAAENLLKNITQHENAYMITQVGWKFMVHESKFNADQVQKAIDSCNTEMSLSVLVQFILLGQNANGGSYALGRDQSDFFLDGLACLVNLVCSVMNSEVIDKFIEYNFSGQIEKGRISLQGKNLNKKAGQELSNVLATLKNGGFIKPTVDDEIQLRSNLDMPELTEEEIEQRREASNDVPDTTQPTNPKNPLTPEQEEQARIRGEALKFSEPKKKLRKEYIEKNETEMIDFMKANLLLIKDKLLADVENTLNRGSVDIQGLKKIEISSTKYLKGLEMKLAGIAQESWDRAKKQAKSAIKLSEDLNPQEIADKVLRQFVLNQSFSVTDQQTTSLLNKAISVASNGSLKGLSINQIVSNVDRALKDYIESNSVSVSGSLIVVGTANFGEMQFNNEIKDQIWGYEFVNDDPVSEICQWYAGKTFSVDSPELADATPPLHPNCKSYMNPIYKSEEEPTIDNALAPASIREQKSVY